MIRRKPRLHSFAREIELGWFTDVGPGTEAWQALAAAVDAFAEISRDKELTDTRLRAIALAAVHPHPSVRGLGTTRLAVLAHYFPEVGAAFDALLAEPDPEIRLYAVTSLANAPPDVAGPRLARALSDEEWGVRKAAAQVCATIPLPDVRGVLAERQLVERDARVRVVLQLAEAFQARGPG
jgi:hypothetical protein